MVISGRLRLRSGTWWLDSQATNGPIHISNKFEDNTAGINGNTAVLSFDIASLSLNHADTHYETPDNGKFVFKIDGHEVASFTKAQLTANDLQHFEVVINDSDYAAGSTHTLELIDQSTGDSASGFAVDNIKINDVTICEPAPVDPHHNGELKAEWTFENHTQATGDEIGCSNRLLEFEQWAADIRATPRSGRGRLGDRSAGAW